MMNNPLDASFWDNRYIRNETGWDIGQACPAFDHYFLSEDIDRQSRVLIPGAGNAYEVDMLLGHGYSQVTVLDIAPSLAERLQQKYLSNDSVRVLCQDFFAHEGTYDIILEQTFFCALPPSYREAYARKMHALLADSAYLVGVLFDRSFEGGPPFGGSGDEYRSLFEPFFTLEIFESCKRSIAPRRGTELFVKLRKKRIGS